jgi:hypothetical protein
VGPKQTYLNAQVTTPRSAYSLHGHVIFSIPALPVAQHGRMREIKSLHVDVEGKSEYYDDNRRLAAGIMLRRADQSDRYVPMRLFSTTITCIDPSQPIQIHSSSPQCPSASEYRFAFPFVLCLPGWLPASHRTSCTNTAYGIQIRTELGWATSKSKSAQHPSPTDSPTSKPAQPTTVNHPKHWTDYQITKLRERRFQYVTLGQSLMQHRTERCRSVFIPFTIRRHRVPPPRTGVEQPVRHYALSKELNRLDPIQCLVSIPEWIDLNDDNDSFNVILRIRTRAPAPPLRPGPETEARVETREDPSANESTELIPSDPTTEGEGTSDSGVDSPAESSSAVVPSPARDTKILDLSVEVEEVERFR